ncbi:porin family protein [Endozoicomonas sp. Mp262]|uniref:porin family protein n=1 Tax=Endozoicomonas sp. Mp262 TaxID=2919499 RepID=UPI0021D92C90
MKKLLAVAAMTIAATSASSVMADNGMFVGAEFGKAKIDGETTLTFGSQTKITSDYEKANQYGIRVGSYINDSIRIYGNLNQAQKDEDGGKLTTRQLTASADYVLDTGYPVKPFIGATLGANWAEIKTDYTSESNWALAYGAQAGVVGQFGQFDVELGYRYLKLDNKLDFSNISEVKVKDSKTPYLAVSYKF